MNGSAIPSTASLRASSHLDDRPVVWLAQQLDDGWDAVVQPHGVLGQFSILVARREVAQGAHGRLSNVLLLPSAEHCVDQGLHPPILSDQRLRTRGK